MYGVETILPADANAIQYQHYQGAGVQFCVFV